MDQYTYENNHDNVTSDSNEVIEYLSSLEDKIKQYKQLETLEIHKIYDIPENKILSYPLDLFKLMLNFYETAMAYSILGFTTNELNFEKKLIRLTKNQDNLFSNMFSFGNAAKINLIKEILMQIQIKRTLINNKYKPIVQKYEQFSLFKQKQIKECSIFILPEDFEKYDKNILFVILSYIEYYYLINGKFIDISIWQNVIDWYRIVGFCFTPEEVLRYNSFNLAPWSEKYIDTVSIYHNTRLISDDEYYSVFYMLPVFILSKQNFIDQLITKIQGIYENPIYKHKNESITKVNPEILSFSVEPREINSGTQMKITWAVKNAVDVKITGLGTVSHQGTRVVKFDDYFDSTTKSISIIANNGTSVNQSIDILIETLKPIQIDQDIITESTMSNFAEPMPLEFNTNNSGSREKSTSFYPLILICSLVIILILWNIVYNSKGCNPEINDFQEKNTEIKKKLNNFNLPLIQMLSDNTQTFSVKNHPKAFEADWQIKIPESWEILPGEKPNVIIKMVPKDYSLQVSMAISANKISVPDGRLISNKEINELFDDPNFMSDLLVDKGRFITGKKILVDGQPGYKAEFETVYKNEIKMRTLNFFFFMDNVIFNLLGTVSSSNLDEDLSVFLDKYKAFYELVANSITINIPDEEISDSFSDYTYPTGVVNSDGVNLRLSPEIQSQIMGMVYRGESFIILDKSIDAVSISNLGTYHWYNVENRKYKGWIYGKFLDVN